jgi:hypothetical protein
MLNYKHHPEGRSVNKKLEGVKRALRRLGIPADVLRDEAKEAMSNAADFKSQGHFEVYVANIVARARLPYVRAECKKAAKAIWNIVKA